MSSADANEVPVKASADQLNSGLLDTRLIELTS